MIYLRPRNADCFLIVGVATALSGPIALELTGGSVIKGDLVSWNSQQAVIKAEFGSLTKVGAEAYATTRPAGNATRGGKCFTASRNSLVRS